MKQSCKKTSPSNLRAVIICKLEKNGRWAQRKSEGVGEGATAEDYRAPEGSMRPLDDQRAAQSSSKKEVIK